MASDGNEIEKEFVDELGLDGARIVGRHDRDKSDGPDTIGEQDNNNNKGGFHGN